MVGVPSADSFAGLASADREELPANRIGQIKQTSRDHKGDARILIATVQFLASRVQALPGEITVERVAGHLMQADCPMSGGTSAIPSDGWARIDHMLSLTRGHVDLVSHLTGLPRPTIERRRHQRAVRPYGDSGRPGLSVQRPEGQHSAGTENLIVDVMRGPPGA